MRNRYFVPVSFGNPFFSRARLRCLRDLFLAKEEGSLVFGCDRLRYYGFRARGLQKREAFNKSLRETQEFLNLLQKLHINGIKNCRVALLSEYVSWQDFVRFGRLIKFDLIRDSAISNEFDKIVTKQIVKFYKTPNKCNVYWQTQYVFWETVASIFITEVEGYWMEIYKSEADMFVEKLYSKHSFQLERSLRKPTLHRRFVPIEGVC